MSLINYTQNVDAKQLAHQGDEMIAILSRIADALDRLAGPPLRASRGAPYKADIADLVRPDAQMAEAIHREFELFAQNANVQLDSEAFLKSIIEFEKQVMEVYGPEAILELPWNKAAGGSLFQVDLNQRAASEERQKASADREPAPSAEAAEEGAGQADAAR